MKTISILGTGWLGLPLAKHFIASDYRVKASTTRKSRLPELEQIGAEPYVIDIDTGDDMAEFLQADILIINIPSKNIDGFRSLIEHIKHSDIQQILFVSSTSVYQDVRRIMRESDIEYLAPGPLLTIEDLFMHIDGVQTTVVRFGGLIGYSRHPGRFFRPGSVVQNPDAPVNLIHRDDCIAIISQIIKQQLWGEVLNGCADTHPTKKAFYSRAVQLLGKELPAFGESNSDIGKSISNEKVKTLLNYRFKHPDLMTISFD